jgi:aldehyde dehydrogenase (NAD+)
MQRHDILSSLGIADAAAAGGDMPLRSPIDGSVLGSVQRDSPGNIEAKIGRSAEAFLTWRTLPAPTRGELVRRFGQVLRENKKALGHLVTLETGKLLSEGMGEVQEMIDICDFAVGLSRQLHGLTIASERPGHHMRETWHPLGPVGVISAFNFPVAVWAWNAALALVCGNSVVWKPSEKTLLCAFAVRALFERVAREFEGAPPGLLELLVGKTEAGTALVENPGIPLISATGSTRMGRAIAPRASARFARLLLELGGNAAMIVSPAADLDLAVRAITFSAVGTAGQRCTTLRRLLVHETLYDRLVERLSRVFETIRVGDPREAETLVGPLVDGDAFAAMQAALSQAREHGASVIGGERLFGPGGEAAFYVRPAIVPLREASGFTREEIFAPILYVIPYTGDVRHAIEIQNDVPQGLSSAIFTTDLREAELFLSAVGSDCGLANVNTGTSGAEIGGAFGGEKETGGGRESGSDSWRAYMRRQTQTVNYSPDLPLSQGVSFDI